ncbi:MAG: DUF2934 domain-containing protein [Acidobacteriota bacterium]|nr:DUF2934 domain-containing protein [Acidobacteriota bacterium]
MAKKQHSSEPALTSVPSSARSRSYSVKHSKAVSAPVAESTIEETTAAVLYDHDAIARLAYSYWEARGYRGGSQIEDWLRAEKEFAARQTLAGSV